MRDDEKYVHKMIQEAGGVSQIDDAVVLIQDYLIGSYYASKDQRLMDWNPTSKDIYNLIVSVFTVTLTTEYLTYQALMGMLNSKLPHSDVIDRVKTLAEVVALIHKAGLIEIKGTQGEYFMITPCLLLEGIPFVDNHATVYDRPQPVESNRDVDQGSMLLGGKLNHYEDDICLDHINRMNSIPMALNKEFLLKYPEEPKGEFTDSPTTKDGKPGMTATEKLQLWEKYVSDGKKRYAHALVTVDRVYLNHKYCTRGRTYAVGYYISTQGSSYKKASIQLANKEYLND